MIWPIFVLSWYEFSLDFGTNENIVQLSQSPIQTAFLNIREQNDESFVKSERILRNFMTAELKISKEGANDISSESVCRIG